MRAEAERERNEDDRSRARRRRAPRRGACDAAARLCVGEDDAWSTGRTRRASGGGADFARGGGPHGGGRGRGGRAGVPVLVPGTFVGRPAGEGRDEGDGSGRDVPVYTCTCEGGKCGRFLKISRRPRTETKHVRRPSRLRARSPSSSRHCRPRRPRPSIASCSGAMPSVASFMMPAGRRHRAGGHALQRRPLARDRGSPSSSWTRATTNVGIEHEAGREQDVPRAGAPSDAKATRAKRPRDELRRRPAANAAGRTSAPPRGESHDFQRPSTRPRKKKGTNTARRFPPRPAPLTEDPSSASADVDDAREERDEHDAPPRAARDDARRGGGDSPAAQDTPRSSCRPQRGSSTGLFSSWDIARECALDAKVINVRDVRWVMHTAI